MWTYEPSLYVEAANTGKKGKPFWVITTKCGKSVEKNKSNDSQANVDSVSKKQTKQLNKLTCKTQTEVFKMKTEEYLVTYPSFAPMSPFGSVYLEVIIIIESIFCCICLQNPLWNINQVDRLWEYFDEITSSLRNVPNNSNCEENKISFSVLDSLGDRCSILIICLFMLYFNFINAFSILRKHLCKSFFSSVSILRRIYFSSCKSFL